MKSPDSGPPLVILQRIEKAKQKGELEMMARKDRLVIEIEELKLKSEEFCHYDELDQMEQVKH